MLFTAAILGSNYKHNVHKSTRRIFVGNHSVPWQGGIYRSWGSHSVGIILLVPPVLRQKLSNRYCCKIWLAHYTDISIYKNIPISLSLLFLCGPLADTYYALTNKLSRWTVFILKGTSHHSYLSYSESLSYFIKMSPSKLYHTIIALSRHGQHQFAGRFFLGCLELLERVALLISKNTGQYAHGGRKAV